MEASKNGTSVVISFSEDEVIVLLEWLHQLNEQDRPGVFVDQSEIRVLLDLEAELERVDSTSFLKNFREVLSMARARIRDKE